jgi:localization factor PodJL
MARAYQQSQPADYDRDQGPAEWQSLRNELVALLDQVEGQVARSSRDTPASERVRDIRHQLAEAEPDTTMRHRDALRSVQRQISRFEEPAPYQAPPPPAAQPVPPNPRDSLQAAINQIRSRQGNAQSQPQPTYTPPPAARAPEPMPTRQPAPQMQQQRVQELEVIEKLAQSVTGLSGRLEKLEGEIKAQIKNGGNVKDVADQVAQLANVVELLAGAVGETGQVKRLEGQIASLGKIMSQGRELDIQTLTRRLDDVAATVGKLAELQVHFTEKVQNPVESGAFKDGMRSIEESVRNVYDRIDALERQKVLQPQDLDVVTREMARFTSAMQDQGQQPQHLVELVDALNSRISDIENGDKMLHALRKDLGALRDAVVVQISPRFDAIDQRLSALSAEVGTRADMAEIGRQIGMLGDRIGERPIDPGISQLEAQVRQLVARMDQTGEQLSGLAKLYAEPAAPAQEIDYDVMADRVAMRAQDAWRNAPQAAVPEIDYDMMADRVAMRAAEAWQKWTPPAADASEALNETIAGLEQRIMGMLQTMPQGRDTEVGNFGGMQAGINEVNDRLKRLEASLLERSASAPAEMVRKSDIAAIIEDAETHAPTPPPAPARPRDAMPRSPAAEAPLNAPPFPEPEPMVESRPVARKQHHPGLSEDVPLAARHDSKPPAPTPSAAFEPPAAPTPSFGFTEPAPRAGESAPVVATEPVSPASRNTFIEAARRAAQRQQTTAPAIPASAAQSNSLIGRALSRFQTSGEKADKPSKATPAKAPRALAGDKPARAEYKPEPVVDAPSLEPSVMGEAPAAKAVSEKGKPMLSPRMRMIVLIVGFVIVGSMIAKFAIDYMLENTPSEPAAEAPITTGDIADEVTPIDGAPMEEIDVADTTAPATAEPRVIDMDPTSTGAIDPNAAQGFTTSPIQAMPQAFSAATDLANVDPLVPQSPVKVELPPEGIGPIELREAAANGDVRAQFEVAAIFTEGRAVPQDYAAAAIWYERAAAAGFAPAQYRLGSLYESGNGVDKNLETAKLWYERAAEAGNRMSMHNLAAIYAGGQLGKQEFESAAKWFEEAANRGMTDSQFNLGMLYARGLGVKQSLEDSFKWFGIAARSGDADAAKARDDIARSLDAETMTRLTDIINNFKPAPIDLAANFAPIGTWSKTFDPGETIATRDIVASVQKALGKLGYDVGTPDGIAGSKTQAAIKQFELATGMSEVGLINPRLLAVLGSQPV